MDAFLFVAVSTLFTLVNPLGAIGPFLAMTVGESSERRRSQARRAAMVASGVIAGSALVGSFVFSFFGITLPALKIAGGILLFFIAYDMVNARPSRTKQTAEEQTEGEQKEDIAVFPLGIPILAGPGSIVSVFVLSEQAKTVASQVQLYGAIAITGLTIYLVLREAHRVAKWLGQTGINVFSRLMGVVLAAISIQFVIDGIRAAFF
ncbi:MAG: MarC family protein [Bdellovibrionota bacterium]